MDELEDLEQSRISRQEYTVVTVMKITTSLSGHEGKVLGLNFVTFLLKSEY